MKLIIYDADIGGEKIFIRSRAFLARLLEYLESGKEMPGQKTDEMRNINEARTGKDLDDETI